MTDDGTEAAKIRKKRELARESAEAGYYDDEE